MVLFTMLTLNSRFGDRFSAARRFNCRQAICCCGDCATLGQTKKTSSKNHHSKQGRKKKTGGRVVDHQRVGGRFQGLEIKSGDHRVFAFGKGVSLSFHGFGLKRGFGVMQS